MGKILIDVPNIERDGWGLNNLKKELVKLGHDVLLVKRIRDNYFTLLIFKPDAIVLGQIEQVHGRTMAKYAKKLGIKVIVLRTEWDLTVKVPNYDELVDLVFTWSKKSKQQILLKTGIKPDKVKVTGQPRFDVYFKKRLMSKAEFCKKYKLDPKKRLVLYCLNPSRQNAIAKVMKLMTENDELIVRPHPWGDPDSYLQLGLNIINSERIWDMLNVCDLHLHTDSNTESEAMLLGKKSINIGGKSHFWRRRKETWCMADGNATRRVAMHIHKFIQDNGSFRFRVILSWSLFTHDLFGIIKNFVYSRKNIRNLYLKIRYRKSNEYLKLIGKEI